MKKIIGILCLSLLSICANAETGLYIGAGVGVSSGKIDTNNVLNSKFKSSGTSGTVYAGFKALSLVAGEIAYSSWGKSSSNSGDNYNADMYSGSALIYLPIPVPFISLYGKLGVASSKVKLGNYSATTTTPVTGLGLEFTALPLLNIRFAADYYGKIGKLEDNVASSKNTGEAKASMFTLGINYKF